MPTNNNGRFDAQDAEPEQELVDLLVAFDTELAGGQGTASAASLALLSHASPEAIEQWEEAKDCLLRLERAWPRATPLEPEMPEAIGRFQVLRHLGQGGFGIVYLAFDPQLGRTVALKVQRPEAILSSTLRERFVREARAAARLRHANIAAVYEVSQEGLQCWIASEFGDGGSLADWLRERRLRAGCRSAAALVAALADAVHYAHEHGVLHRDLKPSNVLLVRTDEATGETAETADLSSFAPKLIDFGLAKLLLEEHGETRTGALLGTPAYMAPEQAGGHNGQLGPATDVYGLGTILYELLIGQPVFRGTSDADTLRRIVADEPASPRQLRGEVPADLEAICLKCLEKDPARRYASAAALAADLRRFLAGRPTLVRPLGPARRLLKWARRRPALCSLWIVSIGAVLAIATTTALYVRGLEQARQAADASAQTARDQEEVANRHLYATRMRLGYEALANGDHTELAKMLQPYRADGPLAQWRTFEWQHLSRRSHGQRATLRGHRGEVYDVAYSPDGQVLASAGQDGTIRFWDPPSGKPLGVIGGHTSCVNSLSYSPDGRLLASGSCDHTIKLWDADTRELVTTLDKREAEVHAVAFSPDGRLLASAHFDHFVLVWDAATQEVVASLDAGGEVAALAWRGNDTLYVACGSALEWSLTSGKVRSDGRYVDSVAISPNGRDLLASAGILAHTLAMFSRTERLLSGHSGRVYSVAFSPDGSRAATGSQDGTVRVWGWPEGNCKQALMGHDARVQSVRFSPDGRQIASASFDGTVNLWDAHLESEPRIETTIHRTLPWHASAISRDLKTLAISTGPRELSAFDVQAGRKVQVTATASAPTALAISPCEPGSVLCYFAESGQISKWNLQDGRLEPICEVPIDRVYAAKFSPDGRHLMAWNESMELAVYDVEQHAVWYRKSCDEYSGGETEPRFSNNGASALVVLGDPPVPGQGTGVFDLHAHKVHYLPSGAHFITLSESREISVERIVGVEAAVRVLETDTGRELFSARRPAEIHVATISGDGRTLATGVHSGWVFLWNIATGQEIANLPISSGTQVHAVQFSSDGRALAALVSSVLPDGNDKGDCNCQLFVWSGEDPSAR